MTEQPKSNKPLIFIFIAFAVGAVMGGMYTKINFLQAGYRPAVTAPQVLAENTQAPPAPVPQKPASINVNVTADDPVLGKASAKLTIVEFGDYQCPFCGRFFKEVQSAIVKDYVDTGKVKFVYKNLAFLGKESVDAANAALCAKDQNKFWEYHDKLYTSQNGENQGAFSLTNLKQFASDLGLNSLKFNACLDAQKYDSQVKADVAEAGKNGFTGTPSTVVGTVPVIGAQPYSQFKTIIDQELEKL
ncbi:MAG: DsbA family protein [Patescibacteria group bacterium]